MQYTVDYRVGGMGNAVVAHIMYACDKVDIDCSNFFSTTGDSHRRRLFANRTIQPLHMIEQPETVPPDSVCIIEIKATGWTKILEFFMGWRKYHKQTPSLDNIETFYSQINQFAIDDQQLWQQFYDNIKDPLWPDCSAYHEVTKLPQYVQDEVYANYTTPVSDLSGENFVSLMSIAVYDHLHESNSVNPIFDGEVLLLQDYLDGDVQILQQQAVKYLGWNWNRGKSLEFYHHLMNANRVHLDWLANMQDLFNKTTNAIVVDCQLETFEQACLIAKLCRRYQVHPSQLPWDSINLTHSTQSLVDFFS